MPTTFTVALTADFYDPQGKPKYKDLGLGLFEEHRHIRHHVFKQHQPRIAPEQLEGANGVVVLTPAVTAQSVSRAQDLLAVGRFGVGYDAVDVPACTEADVLLFITAGAVDRPVAEAVVGWMIALTHHVRTKDELARRGQWEQRSLYMGRELRDRTLGVVGLGGIARKLIELLGGWGMNQPLAFDPFVDEASARSLGVKLVSLEQLLRESDFVSLHCPLNDKTRGLIGARELALMKSGSYLINSARGGIVDEDALFDALSTRRIAGAAIDCFITEPLTQPPKLGQLDNVLLAPHSIAWTEELFRDIGRAVCQGMIDLSLGRRPRGVINAAVLSRAGFRRKWARLCGRNESELPT